MQPPAGTEIVDLVQHRLLAVRERDAVELELAVDPADRRAPGRSAMSISASRTELILSIAALAACTCP